MKLTPNDLQLLSQHAISAAKNAGQIISKYSNSFVAVNTKTGGTSLASQVVTEVDILCQNIILQHLEPTCNTYDLALLTEESPDTFDRLLKDFFWCIDPLDGTLPFIESTSGYAVSIALVSRQGIPCLGVIYDPLKQTLYHAIKGYGAFRNYQPWELSSASTKQPLTFITDRSFKQHSLFPVVIEALRKIASHLGHNDINCISHGGAAMNACWVLEKAPACYFKFPKPENGGGSLWDYAASACIFSEIGAIASDIFGKPLQLNRPDSSFMNHQGVLYSSHREIAKEIIQMFPQLQNSDC